MSQTDYSSNYLLYNSESSKNLVIAVEIEGLSTLLTSTDLYRRIKYGDPGLVYGGGQVYGGLTPYDNYKSLVDLSGGSLTLSQRLEPEQGRGAVSTLSISFIDLNQFMTQLISPGVVLDDILGKSVKVYLGYQQISFPEDYTVIFRGRVSSYTSESGRVTLQFSDPNMVRRQQICYIAQTVTTADISASATTIPVASGEDFFQQILGPDNAYDPGIRTYLQIGEEYIEYPATGWGATAFSGCTRGARGTVAASAAASSQVTAAIEITDHCIDMALKLMLSGWDGPYETGIPIQSFYYSTDPNVPSQDGLVVLPVNKSADRDYGIAVGDYLTFTGAGASANNQTATVLQIVDFSGAPGQGIICDTVFTPEQPTSAVMSIRSQYDTYPTGCGVMLPGSEVDVAQHQYIKNTFMGSDENRMRFFINSVQDSAKTFIESQIYLPAAMYSLTRFGRLSCQLTHAPIADQRLQFLDGSNVLNPQSINPQRGVNNRKFFNEIDWTYDYDDAGTPGSVLKALDTNSLNVIGVSVTLPIDAQGIRTEFGSQTVIDRRTQYLLSRYKNGAVLITIETNWAVGCLIEAGDVVAVKDDGVLQVSNLITGKRNLGTQLFEVINRSLDMKSGKVSLQLCSGIGAEATDRYATISPSSVLQTGSTNTSILLGDSYGAEFPGQENRKWEDYLGIRVKFHDENYTVSATGTLVSQNQVNLNQFTVSGVSLASSAMPGLIMDIDDYSTSTDPYDQQVVKAVHAYLSPQVTITGGISASAFTVDPADIGKFQVGFPIKVHNADYSVTSDELTVSAVDVGTNSVTASSSFGFTPASGYLSDYLGFPDGTATYRLL